MNINVRNVVIASGQSLSGAIQMRASEQLTAIVIPSTWTSASLTFMASPDLQSTPDPVAYDGSELSISVSASQFVIIDISKFIGARQLQVRSGTSSSAVNQTGDRTIKLVTTEL